MCFQLTTLSFLVHVKPQYITVVKRYCRIVWAKKETGDVRSRAAGLKLHMVVTARATWIAFKLEQVVDRTVGQNQW